MATNRPHYHVWLMARTERIFYKLARGFHTRQAARQWARRNRAGTDPMVFRCDKEACRPKLD